MKVVGILDAFVSTGIYYLGNCYYNRGACTKRYVMERPVQIMQQRSDAFPTWTWVPDNTLLTDMIFPATVISNWTGQSRFTGSSVGMNIQYGRWIPASISIYISDLSLCASETRVLQAP